MNTRHAILLIDADRLTGSAIARAVRATFDDEVRWYQQGVAALSRVRAGTVELRLAIVDADLPVLDGRLVAAQLRLLAPQLPILPIGARPELLAGFVELGCLPPLLKRAQFLPALLEAVQQARSRTLQAVPATDYLTAMAQSGDRILAYVTAAPEAPEQALPDSAQRLQRIARRLERFQSTFPNRELRQALKELSALQALLS